MVKICTKVLVGHLYKNIYVNFLNFVVRQIIIKASTVQVSKKSSKNEGDLLSPLLSLDDVEELEIAARDHFHEGSREIPHPRVVAEKNINNFKIML